MASDLLALYGFDLVQALWIDQTPPLVRQALLLIGRLQHQKQDSLFMARRIKEQTLARAAAAAEARAAVIASDGDPDEYDADMAKAAIEAAEQERLANPYEYFGWGTELYKLNEAINAIKLLEHRTLQMNLKPEDMPTFIPSWTPGDEIKSHAEEGAEVIDFDAEDFDASSLPT